MHYLSHQQPRPIIQVGTNIQTRDRATSHALLLKASELSHHVAIVEQSRHAAPVTPTLTLPHQRLVLWRRPQACLRNVSLREEVTAALLVVERPRTAAPFLQDVSGVFVRFADQFMKEIGTLYLASWRAESNNFTHATDQGRRLVQIRGGMDNHFSTSVMTSCERLKPNLCGCTVATGPVPPNGRRVYHLEGQDHECSPTRRRLQKLAVWLGKTPRTRVHRPRACSKLRGEHILYFDDCPNSSAVPAASHFEPRIASNYTAPTSSLHRDH
ncbi:uncharacterized protein M421DRAFT_139521 [Didymella exigua CBS 183.55]|uniref:Uncharacterized protein n=1 Tax=Didymella exigua CBS 183.55 TaxID=1150837 RepID=A0A6A5RR14_9PLEO|nr:uncharacterized protein M421DRAFT_139521 [Didymella exigua CBS 183.55]KAF1929484.1 hypothetical protein M421DRAFT_139521 [Didymella exigua CBS 183.55]